ncbi:heat shock beta-1-like protein [Labeo rohita]|uniref:Heat shock beta-1-like protein n=1 Tax=Labeo rohita TaxID=84645 RepID=A0A498NG49_LABRO|nr:heat shock beta-1-like protein [Labeo rohita]
MEGIFRRLGTSSWPGYLRTPVFAPFTQAPGQHVSTLQREMSGGVSEVVGEMCKWKISLDVNHFAPSEITIKRQDGFLVVAGKHEERQDEHGYIARCFTRKYTLPGGVDAENLQSRLSADGILTVEAPLPSIPLPADVDISIQVDETVGGKQQDGDEPQDGVEAEAKPEGETPEPPVPAELAEGAQVTEQEQQTVSDVSGVEAEAKPEGETPEPSVPAELAEGAQVTEQEQQTVSDVSGVEAEAKPEGETPEPSVPAELAEGAQVTEQEQQTVSDVSGVEAEAKPEGETPEPSVPAELPEGAQVTEQDQQTVSDVDASREPQPESISEAAPDTIESEREQVAEPREEDKEGAFQEAGIERDEEEVHESADKPQAPETPDTITSEQGEQAEVVQPQVLEGEEGYTDPAVTGDEQSIIGQTQEVFTPQQVLQKEMDVGKM